MILSLSCFFNFSLQSASKCINYADICNYIKLVVWPLQGDSRQFMPTQCQYFISLTSAEDPWRTYQSSHIHVTNHFPVRLIFSISSCCHSPNTHHKMFPSCILDKACKAAKVSDFSLSCVHVVDVTSRHTRHYHSNVNGQKNIN